MEKGFTTIRIRNESAEYLKLQATEKQLSVAEVVHQMIQEHQKDVPSPEEIRLARIERLLRVNMSVYAEILHSHNIEVSLPPDDIMSSLEL